MDGISALTPNSATLLRWKFIESFADLYDSNLLDLDLEVKNIGRMLVRKAKDEYPSDLFEFYMLTNRLRDAFFELERLLTIACVISVSTVSCERSFSTIRVVKNYLRNSMSEVRLKSLMIWDIHPI